MGSLATCLPVTLTFEGLWSNNPHDPGGATMKGVTQRVYDAYRKKKGLKLQSVRFISDDELLEIYDEGYFQPIHGPYLQAGVDMAAFDYAVNSGPGAVKGILAKTGALSPIDRVKAICAKRSSFLHGLKTWKYFGKGWQRRLDQVLAISLRMAAESPGDARLQLQIAAQEHTVKAKAKGKAASASLLGSASTAGVAPVAQSDTQMWLMFGAAGLIVLLGVVLFMAIRRHQDTADVLLAYAKEG